jgi:ABC-type glycerol-3-phosphate transport system substrate-binding protein
MLLHKRILALTFLALTLAAGLSACASHPSQPSATVGVPPTVVNSPAPATQPVPASTPDGPLVVTWWAPDFLVGENGGASAALLGQYLREFEAAEGGKVRVNVVPKARYGKGGLLDLLRTAQPVAPAILPDLVALDNAELPTAAADGLLQPLDDVLDPTIARNLYPFARQTGQFDGHLMAVPFLADVEHLVYDRTRVKTPPANWTDLFASAPITYVFPLASPQPLTAGGAETVQQTFVSQYLSAGGTLNSETRQLSLDENALLRVLNFYSQAQGSGILLPNAGEIASLDDSWNSFSQDGAPLAHVSARHYLAGRDSVKNSGFAPLPGYDGPAVPVASGWSLGIVSADPGRKRVAAALVAWLMAPERLGAWTQAAGWLPSLPQAWQAWDASPYTDFLNGQLAAAVAGPAVLADPQVAVQLQKAITGVIHDNLDPKDAIRNIATPAPVKG